MSWFVVGGVAIGATAGAAIGSEKGGDDVWKGALIGGALGAAGGAGAGLGSGAGVLGGIGAETAAVGGTGVAVGGTGAAAGTGGAGIAGTGGASLAGAGGATIPGVGTAAAMPIAGTTTAAIPGTTLAGAGAGAGGGGGILGGTAAAAPEFAMFGGDTAAAAAPEFAMFGGDTAAAAATPSAAPAASTTATNTATNTALKTAGEETAKKGALQTAFDSTLKTMSDHPFLTAGAAYFGLNALGAFDNQNEGQPFGTNKDMTAGYPMSPSFRPSREDPEKYRYTARYAAEGGIMRYAPGGMVQQDPMNPIQNPIYPQSQQQQTNFATSTQYPNSIKSAMASDYDARTNPMTGQEMPMGMAEGGVAHFRKGREVYAGAAQEFAKMADRKLGASAPDTPDWVRSKGIYSDTDPSTRYKNAVDAAITRNAATAKKFDLGGAQLKVPTGGLGSINMGPITKDKKGTDADSDEAFAAGGISTLGGYAHGGNPRLLRGPGDGMSDDIPATIAGRQPARLADGEFVVPADVVSALGNGSTEAGAKHLHAMMDRARQKAHGKKTQMKKVNAKKVLPV